MTYELLIFREPLVLEASSKDDHCGRQPETQPIREAGQKRVLVVDDEPSIADTLTAIFRRAGYEAVAAHDAASALEQCSVFHPDLVLSDVIMPGMDGIEMAILIQQRHPYCKIMLFSGQAETCDLIAQARKSGYDFELLGKPINPNELLKRIAA